MNYNTLIEKAFQVGEGKEIKEIFHEFIKDSIKMSLLELMNEEVEDLCGKKYKMGKRRDFYRAGSAPGILFLYGEKESINRPRVRKKEGRKSREVNLMSYKLSKEGDKLKESLLLAVSKGVSSRDVNEIFPWISRGVSKSTMSRLWVKKGLEYIERFRNRELGSEKFFCLMLDGLSLSEDLYAVAALGITNDGRKLMLDFQIGNSENFEVCNDLVSRLVTRGFKAEHRLYVVIDGSKSLRRAVLKYFPDAVIQRCLVHKERNLSDYLPKRYHKELSYYFKRLRIAEGAEQAQEIYKELHKFLSSKNINALKSLEECGEELIALHMINAPSSLNKTLLSTNCIENAGIHRNLWV